MIQYAKINSGSLLEFPYTWASLRQQNPNSEFDDRFTLEEWYSQTKEAGDTGNTIVAVQESEQPETDFSNYNLIKLQEPTLVNGSWVLTWTQVEKSAEEKAQFSNAAVDNSRF
jgi:hypothetical protein